MKCLKPSSSRLEVFVSLRSKVCRWCLWSCSPRGLVENINGVFFVVRPDEPCGVTSPSEHSCAATVVRSTQRPRCGIDTQKSFTYAHCSGGSFNCSASEGLRVSQTRPPAHRPDRRPTDPQSDRSSSHVDPAWSRPTKEPQQDGAVILLDPAVVLLVVSFALSDGLL